MGGDPTAEGHQPPASSSSASQPPSRAELRPSGLSAQQPLRRCPEGAGRGFSQSWPQMHPPTPLGGLDGSPEAGATVGSPHSVCAVNPRGRARLKRGSVLALLQSPVPAPWPRPCTQHLAPGLPAGWLSARHRGQGGGQWYRDRPAAEELFPAFPPERKRRMTGKQMPVKDTLRDPSGGCHLHPADACCKLSRRDAVECPPKEKVTHPVTVTGGDRQGPPGARSPPLRINPVSQPGAWVPPFP